MSQLLALLPASNDTVQANMAEQRYLFDGSDVLAFVPASLDVAITNNDDNTHPKLTNTSGPNRKITCFCGGNGQGTAGMLRSSC